MPSPTADISEVAFGRHPVRVPGRVVETGLCGGEHVGDVDDAQPPAGISYEGVISGQVQLKRPARGVVGADSGRGNRVGDVDDEKALHKAKKTLIQQLFKPTDGPISRNVNRHFSLRISAFLAQYNISPNSITLVSFGLAILSAIFFYLGGYANILAAGIMAQLSSILDGCDGEIARLKFKFNTFGEWLDKVLDRYADGLMVLGMTSALWKTTGNELVWLVGFLALTGTFVNSYTATIYDDLLRRKLIGRYSLRLGRDVRLFVIFLGAVFNQLLPTIIVLAITTNVESIRRLLIIRHVYTVRPAN